MTTLLCTRLKLALIVVPLRLMAVRNSEGFLISLSLSLSLSLSVSVCALRDDVS